MMTKFNRELADFFKALYAGEERPLVFGDGKPGAKLMLIGEAPGAQEVLSGRPFTGKAGKNLDTFLEMSGFKRADLYISNVVKFRPVKISAKNTVSNRAPTREEVALFQPWLLREIELINPLLIVTLGNTPLQALMGKAITIGQVHGQVLELPGDRSIFALYHPASVIYNPSLTAVYRDDVLKLGIWREANL